MIPLYVFALVVGGGVCGLESALAIAGAGYKVTLVEKDKELGGHSRHVRTTWQGYDVQEYLKQLILSVRSHKKITVMTQAVVQQNRGSAGRFLTTRIGPCAGPHAVYWGRYESARHLWAYALALEGQLAAVQENAGNLQQFDRMAEELRRSEEQFQAAMNGRVMRLMTSVQRGWRQLRGGRS